jgi:hypothetical protein
LRPNPYVVSFLALWFGFVFERVDVPIAILESSR